MEADSVICTIPYSVLRNIAVTPEWTQEKRKVIDGLYYGPCVRTTYQVSRRYWEDEGLNGFGTSDKNFEVWHPTYGKPGRRGLLQAYFYEDYARRLDQLSDGDRIERMIGDMDEVHPGLRRHLETVVTKSWAADAWQRGRTPCIAPASKSGMRRFADVKVGCGSPANTLLPGRAGCRAQSYRALRRLGKSTRSPAQPRRA